MGLFDRNRGEAEPRDEALAVLSVRQARRLRGLVRDSLARAGYEVTVYAGHVEDAGGRQFGLDSLSRTVGGLPERRWAGTVDDHFRRLLAEMDGPDEFDVPTEDLLDRTYLRLYEASGLPDVDWLSYAREPVPGVLELLALDLPNTVAMFNDEHVRRHGLELLRGAGLRNLRREVADERAVVAGVQVLMGSVYLASTALVLEDVVLRTTGECELSNGVLVAMPFRHQLLYHVPRDKAVIEAVNSMARIAGGGYSDGVGPISPHVYWWQAGDFHQLTHYDGDGGIEVRVEGGFAEVLNRIFPDP